MRIRRTTLILIAFAVVFMAANVLALPFANFGSYSALWAQVYGSTNSDIPACGSSSTFYELTDADSQGLLVNFPAPTGGSLVATFVTSCFGVNNVSLNSFLADGLTCDNAVAYRIEANGNRTLWPISCDASGENLWIPGTGLQGHIQLFKLADAPDAPNALPLSHGA